jgi:N-acetylneuraminic acid mutarotase
MIVWGGALSTTQSYGDGARYNPSTGTWTAISSTNAPSARRSHSAVWTGTEMIVWGGSAITQGTPFADGGRYNPATNTWTALPSTGAPSGRFGHSAVWTGTHMIVWAGGFQSTGSYNDGARFDPATSTWSPLPGTPPGARRDHSAVWTGTEMLVWSGSTIQAGGGGYPDVVAYDPVAGAWTTLATTGTAPSSRFTHAAVWTGSEMLIFGGAVSSTGTLGDGARLDRATRTWSALPATGAPTGRRQITGVWTGDSMLVWGGSTILDGGSLPTDAFRFQTFVP